MESGFLSKGQYAAAVKTLKEKCNIYAAGCRKRGRIDEANYFISLSSRF